MKTLEFQEMIWDKARQHYRKMPWRDNTDPYNVLVSELMLQQTQVDRVIPKFELFMLTFPSILSLSKASLADVLIAWNGLGYNRRAKYLHESAKKIVSDFEGKIPQSYEKLTSLPGVGPNTAGAILAYSYNQPVVFIETNIRTVYFHHFFENQTLVSDRELKEIVMQTVDSEHPREWYWALMDYGSFLKKNGAGKIDKSSHYKKQPQFIGSLREVRGQILKLLSLTPVSESELKRKMPTDERYEVALMALLKENLVTQTGDRLHLTQ